MPHSVELVASVKQGVVVIPVPIVDESILHTEDNHFVCGKRDCPCFEALQQAWNELQAIPSYVEQQAKAWSQELDLEIE